MSVDEVRGAEEAAAHLVHVMLGGIESMASGNKLVSGRVLDEAMARFLLDVKLELGDKMAEHAAAHLIRSLICFLPKERYDRVLAALG